MAQRTRDPGDLLTEEDFLLDGDARVQTLDWEMAAPVVKQFIHDPTFISGFFGPLGCSKTASGGVKVWSYGQAWPGANVAVIRTTWPRLRDTTMQEFFKWFPKEIAGHYEAQSKTFHLQTGAAYGPEATIRNEPAHIMFRAMDDAQDVENVLSLSLAAAWVDEPQGGLAPVGKTLENEPGLDHTLFLHLLSRLGRQPGYLRMCWLTGNPPDPAHWIAKEFGYGGKGRPENRNPKFHLYLGDQDTNRRNLYHHYVGGKGEPECRLCGQGSAEVIHQQGDYYEDLEVLFGHDTPLALRFIHGLWIPFKSLRPFDAGWIVYLGELPEAERPTIIDCFNVLAIDPAITKRDEGCRTSMTLAGTPREGLYRTHRFIWRNDSGHWSPYDTCDKALAWIERFPVKKLRIEANAYQGALGDIIQREAAQRGIPLPALDLIHTRTDKMLGAMQWSGSVETGHIVFDPSCTDLIACMLDVPGNKMAWDPVDATGIALGGLPLYKARQTRLPKPADAEQRRRAVGYAAKATPPAPAVQTGARRFPGRTSNAKLRARARGYAVRV